MLKKVDFLKNSDIIMVLENEAGLYGQHPDKCVEIVQAVNSPRLRLCYDPANFTVTMNTKDNVHTCWPVMRSYVSHVHIKDWKVGEDIGSIPGQGDAQIMLLLKELRNIDYKGFITMEPHLQQGGQFGGSTDTELFSSAINETKKMAHEAGLILE